MSQRDRVDLGRLEESLWTTATRCDDAYMDEIFAEDFVEFGRSGRVWSREDMLPGSSGGGEIRAELAGMSVRSMGGAIVLVTYQSAISRKGGTEFANRASIWSRGGKFGWRLRFHQGTPVAQGAS
ncbi:MAG: nuclear transport factor 2 family protein [Pseudomonadota bacterium]|nr:nuclear transport factor 2 family protein [Pseudomonadota bacterium]